jgi:hypothetical protein
MNRILRAAAVVTSLVGISSIVGCAVDAGSSGPLPQVTSTSQEETCFNPPCPAHCVIHTTVTCTNAYGYDWPLHVGNGLTENNGQGSWNSPESAFEQDLVAQPLMHLSYPGSAPNLYGNVSGGNHAVGFHATDCYNDPSCSQSLYNAVTGPDGTATVWSNGAQIQILAGVASCVPTHYGLVDPDTGFCASSQGPAEIIVAYDPHCTSGNCVQ